MKREDRPARATLATISAADITTAIAEHGWAVCDDFVSVGDIEELAAQAQHRLAEGEFHPAGLGAKASHVLNRDVRRDLVLCIDPAFGGDAQRRYAASMESLRSTLNQTLYLGLLDLDVRFAVYEVGAYYKTHVDRFPGSCGRVLSCILYLNAGWSVPDGGELRLYLSEADRAPWVDIEPIGGRLVCFSTERFAHEVLPVARERLSLSGWFCGRA